MRVWKKFLAAWDRVFFNHRQAHIALRESGPNYGECTSGPDFYAYTGNDPINFIDPTGTCGDDVTVQEQDANGNWVNAPSTSSFSGYVICGADAIRQFTDQLSSFFTSHQDQIINGGIIFAGVAVDVLSEGRDRGAGTVTATKIVRGQLAKKFLKKNTTTVIGRTKDLENLAPGEESLLGRLTPDLGNPKANWARNSGVLRDEMGWGLPIRDASPGDTGGAFLNAERALLRDRGWTFDPQSNYWMPPAP